MFNKIDKKGLFCLIFILVLASFLRLWKLDSIPPGLYPDEAINGNEAILNPGKIFFKENNGREGLFINLIALSFSLFGPSIFSLRLVPAICGILTVLGLYLLTKELFKTIKNQQLTINNELVALLASFFLATSFWHINFSRIAFRGVLVPLLLVFSFYFLFKGFRKKRTFDFIVSGILFGLGFHTYIAFRVAALLLGMILVSKWFTRKGGSSRKTFILNTLYFILAITIVALPIGIYFLKNPSDFFGRAAGVSIFTQKNPLKALVRSLFSHLLMFNFYGDYNWRHNISGSPILFWPVGILFLIGLFYSLRETYFAFRNKNYSLLTTHLTLISWWFIMLIPGILTSEGIPHALRSIGAIPPSFIWVGLGGSLIFKVIRKRIPFKINGFNYYLIIFSLIFLTLSFILAQHSRYFELWAKNPETKNAFSKDFVGIGNYLNSLADKTQKYVIVNQPGVPIPYPEGIPVSAQTPMFMEIIRFGETRSIYLLSENLDQIKIEEETEITLLKYDQEIFSKLITMFPMGEIQEENGIWIFNIR